MPAPDSNLARQLLDAREDAGITQEQLAEKLGISRTQVGRIETGKRGTYVDLARRWFEACGHRLEVVRVGSPSRVAALSGALDALSGPGLDLAIRMVRVMPNMSPLARRMLADIVEACEAPP